MPTWKGQFQITGWHEATLRDSETGKLSQARVTQSYSGDISANSEIHYLMQYDANGNASFSGYEAVTLEQGVLVLSHQGTFEQGVASSQFEIQGSASSGKFAGASGQGHFSAKQGGQADYEIEIQLPA